MMGSPEVSIRALNTDDAEQIAHLINNKKIWDNLRDYIPYPYHKKDADDFINLCLKQSPTCTFGIVYRNELCGVMGIIPQSDIYRLSGEIGYWIGEPFWGKGIATNALHLAITYSFDQLGLNRLFAVTFGHNKASIRVLEKCGFKHEGIGRGAIIKNNQILDEHRYALLKSDQLS